jgi:hypothetical protein
MGFSYHVIVVVVGVVLILVCARLVVGSSIGLARRYGLSDSFIGMTVLSIGTSLPEIITHLAASFRILREPELMDKMSAISIGTNIGSDVFQQNFLLGVVALVGAVTVTKRELRMNVGGLVVAAVALFIFSIGGVITRLEGAILAGGYIVYLYGLERRGEELPADNPSDKTGRSLWKLVVETVAGFAVMSVAADRVLDSAVVIVEHTFLSYSFFGHKKEDGHVRGDSHWKQHHKPRVRPRPWRPHIKVYRARSGNLVRHAGKDYHCRRNLFHSSEAHDHAKQARPGADSRLPGVFADTTGLLSHGLLNALLVTRRKFPRLCFIIYLYR